ncbi:MAG: hypothetical protein QGF59_03370, partial [Pirellulaceae bacterium]|nr:hypothetical protein [Pirellulaceae bacterium]
AQATPPVPNSRDLYIGGAWGGGSPQRHFRGRIDEIIYHNVALTAAEVQAGMTAPSPVSHWRGEGDYTDSADGNDGAPAGGVAFGSGFVGQGFSFDGSSGTVVVPDAANLDLMTEFTLEAWINPSSLQSDSARGGVISKIGGGGGNNGYQFGITNNNETIYCQFNATGEPWPTNAASAVLGSPVPVGQWSHIACTYDNSDIDIYLDGALVGSANIGPKTVVDSSSSFRISRDDNGAVLFHGAIDEVKVYNTALSPAQIASAVSCVYWANPVSGNWNDATKWSTGVVPGASDHVCISAAGSPYTVTLNVNTTIAGFTMDSADATFFASSKTFTVNGPSNLDTGSVTWRSSAWAGIGTLTNSAILNIEGSSTISAAFAQKGTVNIRGGASNAATLTSSSGFTNDGAIVLQTVSSTYSSNLEVTSGTLTNTSSGVINSNPGTGGSRSINATVVNNGTVNFSATSALAKSGATFTNNGTTTVASGKTLSFGTNGVFTQSSGLLSLAGTLAMVTDTLNINGGTSDITGTAHLNGSDLNWPSGTILGSPMLTLLNTDLALGAAATSAATSAVTFQFGASSNTLSGDIKTGQTVVINGGLSLHAWLTSPNGFTNSGLIILQTLSSTYSSNLAVTSGTLTNSSSGVINSNPGTGGSRSISATVVNNGTVNLNQTTTLSKTSGVYTNNGTTTIASGKTLSFGSSSVFNQNGGSLAIGGAFNMSSDTLNFNGGVITGTPLLLHSALNLGAGSTSPASFITRGSSTLSGNVKSGQLITVQGSGTGGTGTLTSASGYTNSGTLTLQSIDGGYTTNLTVNTGTLTNTASGVINSNLGSGGGRNIYAHVDNGGIVNINKTTVLGKTSGVYTNNGTTTIASGKTLNFGNSSVFNQNGGSLAIIGTFAMSSDTFNFNGGMITGTNNLYSFFSVPTWD